MKAIKFNDEMVRAILSGNKTQTRKPVKRLLGIGAITEFKPSDTRGYDWAMRDRKLRWNEVTTVDLFNRCPYGKVGDRVWVKEAFSFDENLKPIYRSSGASLENSISWNSASAMTPWCSRITLEITELRVERVQDITHEDAIREGVKELKGNNFLLQEKDMPLSCHAFAHIWDSIYAKKSFGWHANPYVWAIEFRRA